MTLLADPPTPFKTNEPQQGVIEDARRRRDVRRARVFAALVAAMLMGAVIWAVAHPAQASDRDYKNVELIHSGAQPLVKGAR